MLVVDRSRSAKTQIYAWLKNKIVHGDYFPGAIINKNELAKTLQVSITPLREALILLTHERLIESTPNLNTRVSLIDLKILNEVLFIRSALEGSVVEYLTEKHLSKKELLKLNAIINEQEKAFKAKDYDKNYSFDFQFHQYLFKLTDYPSLWKNIELYRSYIDRVLYSSPANEHLIEQAINDHRAIVDAIANHDVLGARAKMKQHLLGIIKDLPNIPKAYLA